jgi:hypothetical protein
MRGGILDHLVPVARRDSQDLEHSLKKARTSGIVPDGRLLVRHDDGWRAVLRLVMVLIVKMKEEKGAVECKGRVEGRK